MYEILNQHNFKIKTHFQDVMVVFINYFYLKIYNLYKYKIVPCYRYFGYHTLTINKSPNILTQKLSKDIKSTLRCITFLHNIYNSNQLLLDLQNNTK